MEIFNEIISIKEASKKIGIKEATLRWHIAQGNFKKGIDCKKYGSTWIFKKDAINKLFKDTNLNLSKGKYTKENYPTLIEVNDLNKYSNLIGYIPANENLDFCPRLIIDKDIVIGFFRGYYITDLSNKYDIKILPNKSRDYKSINEFKAISDAINYLIKSSGLEERYFNQHELHIIKEWYKESISLYSHIWSNIDNINF